MFAAILLSLVLLVYAAAFAAYLSLFINENESAIRASGPLFITGLLLHVLLLGSIWLTRHHFPLSQVGETLLTVVLLYFLIYLVLEFRIKQRSLGVFILGVGLVLLIVAATQFEERTQVPELLVNNPYILHVLASISGYAGLFLAAIAGGLLLLLRHQIKAKNLGAIYQRLPSLETLDRMGYHATLLGFIFLATGFSLGAIFLPHEEGLKLFLEPKVLVTFVLLVLNAFYLFSRFFLGWRRRKTAWISIVSFAILLVSIIVLPWIPKVFHEF